MALTVLDVPYSLDSGHERSFAGHEPVFLPLWFESIWGRFHSEVVESVPQTQRDSWKIVCSPPSPIIPSQANSMVKKS